MSRRYRSDSTTADSRISTPATRPWLRIALIQFAVFVDTALWRALASARFLEGTSPRAARWFRRLVLLFWWTATGQLHIHARYWLRARRLRRIAPVEAVMPTIEPIEPRDLVVPFSDTPVVSIIVPTYGQIPFTLRCLSAVAEHTFSLPIEVIVVDDAWADPEGAALSFVRGIRLVRNDANLGFLRSCNKAAARAKGQYLCFLNNDTQVMDGWLEPMLSLFDQRGDTGAVGAKLLYPDGRLQEAGGIIWQDGSGWNFGRLEDAARPEYNYVREVDYCSGAALTVRREVFNDLGGFDDRYAPAYFEDSDLCFRLRRSGLKVLYQPASRVVHHEGISHGRDTTVGLKSYQVTNRRRFVETWAEVLARDHFPNGENVFRARDRAMHRKVVLVVDHYVPTPDRDAGSRTMMGWLQVLVDAGLVVKFWPHNLSYNPGYTELLLEMGIEVFHGPEQAPFEAWIKNVGADIDLVLVSRPEVAEDVLPAIRRCSRARTVYYGHDLHFRRMQLQADIMDDARLRHQAVRMREREEAIWQQADVSLYPSDEEAGIALALQPDVAIRTVVPYYFPYFGERRLPPSKREIIFVGGFGHQPNEDAAVWFVSKILPSIRMFAPGVRLSIVGSNPTERVRALECGDVTVADNVSDAALAAAYDRARVAVVPLRCGAGVKLKVAEALRAGVPLVTTTVGAQGLPELGHVVAVEDDPMRFAAAVVVLLTDDTAWGAGSAAQIEFARARFSREVATRSLLGALEVT